MRDSLTIPPYPGGYKVRAVVSVKTIRVEGFYPSQNVTDVHVVDGLLCPNHCASTLKRFQDAGLRSNGPTSITDEQLAARIFLSVEDTVPLFREDGFEPVECGPGFHLYRWSTPGDRPTPRSDEPYAAGDIVSFYTVLVYLNDDYEGGEVIVGASEKFKPHAGTALVLPHYVPHSAAPLVSGTCCTMRTAVMYRSAKLRGSGHDEDLP